MEWKTGTNNIQKVRVMAVEMKAVIELPWWWLEE